MAATMEAGADLISDRIRKVTDEIERLEAERQVLEMHERRQRVFVKTLRLGLPLAQGLQETAEDAAASGPAAHRPRYGPSFSLALAIVDVVGHQTLHRDEIVSRLSDRGYEWDGRDPQRTVGTTLGKNSRYFEQVSRHVWRLREKGLYRPRR
jgi:hypothetical protein